MARRPKKPTARGRWRENVEMNLRLPQRLRRRLEVGARLNEQSLNWEIIQRLGRSFQVDSSQRADMAEKTFDLIFVGGLGGGAVSNKMTEITYDELFGGLDTNKLFGGLDANDRNKLFGGLDTNDYDELFGGSADIVQVKLRIPGDVRLRLEREAARNDRSMNREIVERLGRSFEEDAYRKGDIDAQAAEMLWRGLDDAVIRKFHDLALKQARIVEEKDRAPSLGRRVFDRVLGRPASPSQAERNSDDKQGDQK